MFVINLNIHGKWWLQWPLAAFWTTKKGEEKRTVAYALNLSNADMINGNFPGNQSRFIARIVTYGWRSIRWDYIYIIHCEIIYPWLSTIRSTRRKRMFVYFHGCNHQIIFVRFSILNVISMLSNWKCVKLFIMSHESLSLINKLAKTNCWVMLHRASRVSHLCRRLECQTLNKISWFSFVLYEQCIF